MELGRGSSGGENTQKSRRHTTALSFSGRLRDEIRSIEEGKEKGYVGSREREEGERREERERRE